MGVWSGWGLGRDGGLVGIGVRSGLELGHGRGLGQPNS